MNNVVAGNFPSRKHRRMKAAQYVRDIESTRDLPYGQKFADFLKLCDNASSGAFEVVMVAFPQVLGDDYDELTANLSRAADAGLLVSIASGK